MIYLSQQKQQERKAVRMSEKELNKLYDLLEKLEDEEEKAALRHAIFIIETNGHIY